MPDTERYREWVARLSASDTVLVQLVLIAATAVFAWESLRAFGEPWRGRLRLLYVSVALSFLLVQVVTTRGALIAMLVVLVGSIVARRVWNIRRRHLAGALSSKGVSQ